MELTFPIEKQLYAEVLRDLLRSGHSVDDSLKGAAKVADAFRVRFPDASQTKKGSK